MDPGHTPHPPNACRLADYPVLARLGLEVDDLAELARQGFVSSERRPQGTRYKLRFRRRGQQVVRFVREPAEAALLEQELAKLQSRHRLAREWKTLDRLARRELRDSQDRLASLIERHGFKFHGRALRRPRRTA